MKVEKILKIIEKIGLLFLTGLILVVILNIYIYISVADFYSKVLNLFYATNKITIANDYFFINSYDDFENLANDINSEMELFQKAFFKVNKGFIKRIFFRAFDSSFSEIEKDIDQLNYKFKSIYLIVKKLAKYSPENSAVLFNFLNNISSVNSSLISDIELLKIEFYNNKILTTNLLEKVDKISKDINTYSNILKKNIISYFFLFLLIYVSLYPLFVFVLFSVIRLKIKKLVDNMHKIRNGASILLLDSKEEMLSELYANIKDIVLKNKDLFELKTNIISLDRKSSVIGQLTNKIKDEILNQKHYLLSTTNSFKSLKDTIVTVSDSTLKTNFVTLETRDKTVSSCHTIRETIEGFKSLSETASKIFGILKIISAITDQTELLSLSASIESARAGEVGKGFNIVANEIRKLSESTVLSTKEISNFAKQIIKIIKTAISKSEFSNDALLSIEASVVEISKSITSLSGVAESHSNKCLEISNEVEEINKLNNEIFLLFEELTETIHNFSSKIDVLIKLSEKFDISSKAAISRKIRLVEVN